jgi:hypothetical protein
MGQAAGLAAAIASATSGDVDIRSVGVATLQQKLEDEGAYLGKDM